MQDISIKNIIGNFKYLKSQNIIDNNTLEKIFFNKLIYSDEEIIEIITKNIKDNNSLSNTILLLNKKETTENQLEIRDYFLYLINAQYLKEDYYDSIKLNIWDRYTLDNIEIINKEKNKKIFKLYYPHYNPLIKNSHYSKYFQGISYLLFELLKDINPSFYKKISSGDEKVLLFIDSLYTIKEWDNLDELLRRENLKNEIVGKILYVCTEYIVKLFSKKISPEDYLKTEDFYKTLRDIKLDDELLENAIKSDFSNEIILDKIIELYPFSIEILRNKKELFQKKYSLSLEYGYLTKEDIPKIENISNYSYYIYNDMSIKMIPYLDQLTYLNNTIFLYRKYQKEKNPIILNNVFKNIDCYIRNVSYYDKDIESYQIRSADIFDENKKYSIKDKSTYLQELIAEYKDKILNITLGIAIVNYCPIAPISVKKDCFNQLNILKDMYIYLLEKYQININQLNEFLTKDTKFKNKVIEYENSNDDKKIVEILNLLAMISYQYKTKSKEEIVMELKSESQIIINILNNIINTPDELKYAMNLYTKEYQLFNIGVMKYE